MNVPVELRYRLYIDETGIQSMKGADSNRYLCLMGIIMRRNTHDGPTTQRLSKLKSDLFGHTPEDPVILHRREIVRGKPPFDLLRGNPILAKEFQARWIALVRETKYLAMAAAIDKRAHLEKYTVWQHDPYHYCLECLLERYVSWLKRHGFVGDVIVEARGKGPDKRLKAAYRHFYQRGKDYLSPTVIQGRLTTAELKFAQKTHDVAALQIADSLAHPTLAYMKAVATGEPVPTTFGQQLVDILKAERYARHPKTHQIQGWGLKMLP